MRYGIQDNYLALAHAILISEPPDKILREWGLLKRIQTETIPTFTDKVKEETLEILDLREQGMTYRQIAKIYNISESGVLAHQEIYTM